MHAHLTPAVPWCLVLAAACACSAAAAAGLGGTPSQPASAAAKAASREATPRRPGALSPGERLIDGMKWDGLDPEALGRAQARGRAREVLPLTVPAER